MLHRWDLLHSMYMLDLLFTVIAQISAELALSCQALILVLLMSITLTGIWVLKASIHTQYSMRRMRTALFAVLGYHSLSQLTPQYNR